MSDTHVTNPLDGFSKDNSLIRMILLKNQMNAHQQRFFNAVVASVQYMKKKNLIGELEKEGDLELRWSQIFTLMKESGNLKRVNRQEVKRAVESLLDVKFMWDIKSEGRDEVGGFVLFQKVVVDFENDKVLLTFGKDFRTQTLLPSTKYTVLSQYKINALRSHYSRALYETFLMYIGKNPLKPFRKDITLEVSYLKRMMGINEVAQPAYHKNTGNFVLKCIKTAVDEINNKSDVIATFERIKEGKNITQIYFTFAPTKTMMEEPTQAEEAMEAEIVENAQQSNMEVDNSLKKELYDFRQKIIVEYMGKPITTGLTEIGFSKHVTFEINNKGLLKADMGEVLSKEKAFEIWEYLYINQHKVGQVLEISKMDKLTYQYVGLNIKMPGRIADDEPVSILKFVDIGKDKVSMYIQIDGNESIFFADGKKEFTTSQLQKYLTHLVI